jgi:hypothetical protein
MFCIPVYPVHSLSNGNCLLVNVVQLKGVSNVNSHTTVALDALTVTGAKDSGMNVSIILSDRIVANTFVMCLLLI